MKDYTSEIRFLVEQASDLSAEEISVMTNDDSVVDFGVDSLALVEVIMTVENKYLIEIELGDVNSLHNSKLSVNSLNEIVNMKVEAKAKK